MRLENKRVLITGGTGSLGKVLTSRILAGEIGKPKKVMIFSRDEAKQHDMRIAYQQRRVATDEIIYHNFEQVLEFRIGDVRDLHSITSALRDADIVFNAAALKQVPACEYFPFEAVRTNIEGAENIVRAIRELHLPVDTVVGISTDKACKPVNVMGMSKAIQERIFISANLMCPSTRFICVRYGNVLASRGSVIPLFHDQIRNGGPVTITSPDMTRFLLSLDDAVDTVFAAIKEARRGETYIPRAPSATVVNIAHALIGSRDISIKTVGIRPGEKMHEVLISEEEIHHCLRRGGYYTIQPMLPELKQGAALDQNALEKEYSSADEVLDLPDTIALLKKHRLMVNEADFGDQPELLR